MTTAVAVAVARPSRLRRFGVPVVLALVAATAYLWNLEVSGYANTYYSAAAQAASQSWTAMFFGSMDAAGFITVDKPPVALWVMGLSVRLLGVNPLAMLLPQALAGVAAVLVLHATVRRQLGELAAGIAGLAFAVTPVAALIFRYNNPDAVLVLLLLAAAWAVVRGLEHGSIRWAALAGVLVGLAFLTKYLQAWLVLPAFLLVWLVAAPGSARRRIGGVLVAGVAVLVSSAWWVLLVDAIPATARPYIGGSTNNTALDLVLGYDGLGRIFGGFGGPGGTGSPAGGLRPGGGPGAGFGGTPGLLRMFNSQWGGEISWLLPAAGLGLIGGLAATLRSARTDPRRAAILLWGGWALVHVLVFSLMSGVAHPYYAVAIAPAAAALVGGGIALLWERRHEAPASAIVIGLALVASAWWGMLLLDRTPAFWPGLGLASLAGALAAAVLLAGAAWAADDPRSGMIGRLGLALGVGAILVGPVLYAGATTERALAGGDPAAGPADARGDGGFAGGPGPGAGGLPGDGATTSDRLLAYLVEQRGSTRWLVAAASANEAAPIQLETGAPVMAMGGFTGGDPVPTLDQFKEYVASGNLRFVLLGGRGGPGGFPGGSGSGNVAAERTTWVTQACTPVTSISASLYDCAGAVTADGGQAGGSGG